MKTPKLKLREINLRQQADRAGFILSKSRTRDPSAPDYKKFSLTDARTGELVNEPLVGFSRTWTIEDVERHLSAPMPSEKKKVRS